MRSLLNPHFGSDQSYTPRVTCETYSSELKGQSTDGRTGWLNTKQVELRCETPNGSESSNFWVSWLSRARDVKLSHLLSTHNFHGHGRQSQPYEATSTGIGEQRNNTPLLVFRYFTNFCIPVPRFNTPMRMRYLGPTHTDHIRTFSENVATISLYPESEERYQVE